MFRLSLKSLNKFSVQNFKKIQSTHLPDFNCQLEQYEQPQGFQHLHFKCDDNNKTFATLTKIINSNHQGVPHVLEHLMCCGSKKYPVKDPFMNMTKRSVNTYMNAWTGHDFIAFPFSTLNDKDFANLLDVYLDMVLRPNLNYLDFLQEGWREEYENNQLGLKGVVYNEMKGDMQNPDFIFSQELSYLFYEDHIYGKHLGGDPKHIIQMKHQNLLDFYTDHFNPANVKIFTYGNIDPNNIHNKILKEYQDIFSRKPNYKSIPSFQFKPKHSIKIIQGPTDAMAINSEKQARFAIQYLLPEETKNPLLSISLSVLSNMLFNQRKSLLMTELIDSGIASQFGPIYGFSNHLKIPTFAIGVNGIKHSQQEMEKLKDKINDILKKIATQGFEKEMIEVALHQYEIYLKLPKSSQGLSLFQNVLNAYNHDLDIQAHLNYTKNIQELRNQVEKGQYFENLLQKYIINNQNYTSLAMVPNEKYFQDISEEEIHYIQNKTTQLKEDEKQVIINTQKQLLQHQQVEQNLEVLPSLSIKDIKRTTEQNKFEQSKVSDVDLFYSQQPLLPNTTTLRFKLNLPSLTGNNLYYSRLLSLLLNKIGTDSHTYSEINQLLGLNTNGLRISFNVQQFEKINAFYMIQFTSLNQNLEKAIDLLAEILIEPFFKDNKNISTILNDESANINNSLIEDALGFASSQASASLKLENHIIDINSYFDLITKLTKSFNSASGAMRDMFLDDITFQMTSLINQLINKFNLQIISHSNDQNVKNIQSSLQKLITKLEKKYQGFQNRINFDSNPDTEFQKQYIRVYNEMQLQVNFCVQAIEVPNIDHEDYAALLVGSKILQNTQLHQLIREQGGAYGAFTSLSHNGILQFKSYRDPNHLKTIQYYSLGVDNIAEGKFTEEELEQSKLTIFQSIDQPTEIYNKGVFELLNKISHERRQQIRNQIIDMNRDQVINAINTHIKPKIQQQQTSIVINGQQLNEQDRKDLTNHHFKIVNKKL